MHIPSEGLLTQLGYHPDERIIAQLHTVEENTPGFEQIKRHVVALSDHLKSYGGYVAISNSKPYLKIKIEANDPSKVELAKAEIFKWADKYNVALQKVPNKETYYILGISK